MAVIGCVPLQRYSLLSACWRQRDVPYSPRAAL